MKKTLFAIISILVWIIGVSIIIFNNGFQLINSLILNNNLLISFLVVTIGVSVYGIYNKTKLKKELS